MNKDQDEFRELEEHLIKEAYSVGERQRIRMIFDNHRARIKNKNLLSSTIKKKLKQTKQEDWEKKLYYPITKQKFDLVNN